MCIYHDAEGEDGRRRRRTEIINGDVKDCGDDAGHLNKDEWR